MKPHKTIYRLAILILALGMLLSACGGENEATPSPDELSALSSGFARVSATGEVVPVQWSTLGMAVTGIIEEIMVSEGQGVSKGQELLRLKGREQREAALAAAELELLSAQQSYDDLFENLEAARAAAKARLAAANKALDKAEERRENQAYRRGDQEQIDQAWANYVLAQQAVEDAEQAFELFADRPEDDTDRAFMLSKLASTRQARDRAEANFNYIVALPDQLEVDEIDAQLAVARAEVVLAQDELDKLNAGPDPELLALTEARLKNAKKQVEAAGTALEDLVLKAPFGGTISRLNVRTSEWVTPGQPAVLLADLSKFQVETTDLSEIDVAQVQVGSPVTVTFDALPDVVEPGRVVKIAPKSSEGSGVNYTVTIELEEIPDGLRWGMTAFVDIEVER